MGEIKKIKEISERIKEPRKKDAVGWRVLKKDLTELWDAVRKISMKADDVVEKIDKSHDHVLIMASKNNQLVSAEIRDGKNKVVGYTHDGPYDRNLIRQIPIGVPTEFTATYGGRKQGRYTIGDLDVFNEVLIFDFSDDVQIL